MSKALVLCYHAVSSSWNAPLAIGAQTLERQITLLLRLGWTAARFSDAVLEPKAAKTLAITFDDAYASVTDQAVPLLRELGVPGTVFVPTTYVTHHRPLAWDGTDQWLKTPFEQELTPMTWENLGELVASGWEVGSHTLTHPHLPRCDDATLERELAESREECMSRLGGDVFSLAYPYGDVDQRVAEAARHAGYRTAAGLPGSLRTFSARNYPRLGVYAKDVPWRLALKVARHSSAAMRVGS